MKPLVSIITPSYNQGKYIRQTIESVLTQDYANMEYIIVDGGSTDNTLDIIHKYEGKLTYISEKDNGQSDAINKGFRMARGEIVAWLNSDDVYEPDCINKAVKEFEKNQKLGLVYGDGYIIDETGNKLKVFEHTQEFDYWKLVNFWDYIMQPTTFFRWEALQEAGYLDSSLHFCMDWDLWIRLAAISEVKYIPELLACSREYADTKTNTGGRKRLNEIIGLLQKYSQKDNPLGAGSYKASTFYIKHANAIWPVRKYASLYLTCMHKWLEKQIPVRYSDGWIGKKYALIVPKYISKVTITVESVFPKTIPQVINMYINQVNIGKKVITQPGRQTILFELQRNNSINEIALNCKKAVRSRNGDGRLLSIKVIDIVYE